MCGLFGHTLTAPADLGRSRTALHTLTHRGPDQWGDWQDQRLYLGHRRLSILDLSDAGRQPMQTRDGLVLLTVNGEIYNHTSLRWQLEPYHSFQSHSDSEVILHGYRHWGIAGLLERLEGMYAFVLYDSAKAMLYLVRDPVGIKPLYYAQQDGQILWASELKALVSYLGESNLTVDHSAFYDYLTYLYIPAPKSLYRNIYKLPPAQYAAIDLSQQRVSLHRYWSLTTAQHPQTLEEAKANVRALVSTAVAQQGMADVPVGFFLSGGMDSSVVIAEAAQHTPSPHSFTLRFAEKGRDESPYAEQVARHFHTQHVTRDFDGVALTHLTESLHHWFDEPFADLSAFPTYQTAALAREHVTVALTGDGGDEVFGGYRWYQRFQYYQRFQGVLRPLAPLLRQIKHHGPTLAGKAASRLEFAALRDPLALYTKLLGGMLAEEKTSLKAEWEIAEDYDDYWALRRWWREDLPPYTRMQYLDFHTYLPDDILTKVDRTTMAVGIEARVPLLSLPLVTYLFSLPEAIRLPGGVLKGLMKAAYEDILPQAILKRPKQGFSIPTRRLPEDWRHRLFTQNVARNA